MTAQLLEKAYGAKPALGLLSLASKPTNQVGWYQLLEDCAVSSAKPALGLLSLASKPTNQVPAVRRLCSE